MSNTIETSRIVNVVSFKVDQNSYKRALNAIRKIGSEWSRVTSKMSGAMAQGRAIGGGGVRPSGSPRRQFVGPPEFKAGKNTRQQMKQQAIQERDSNRVANTIATASIGRNPAFIKAYAEKIDILNQKLKAGIITSAQYNKHLNSMARDFRNAQNSAGGLLSTTKELRSAFVALTATYTAFAGGKAIMTTGQTFQSIESGMAMATEGPEQAAQQIKFLREESYRLGLDLKVAAQGFTQMSIAGKEIMKTSEINDLFTGISEYSTALGVDSFRYEKSVLAIVQMLGKQKITAEELRQQLSEQLPGAMDTFVKAAGEFYNDPKMDTAKLFKIMEDGKLLAKDILPLVGKRLSEAARKGNALEKMLKGNMVAMNRLKQTWQSFQNEIFLGGFGSALTKWFNMLAAMLKQNEGAAKTFGAALGAVMDQLLDKITKLYDYILFLWLDFKYYILDNIPDGVKGIIADFGAWAVSIGIVAGALKGVFSIAKKILGLGSLSKSLGLGDLADTGKDGKAGGKGGKGSKGITMFGWLAALEFGFDASSRLEAMHKEAAKQGISVGEYMANKVNKGVVPTSVSSPTPMVSSYLSPNSNLSQSGNWRSDNQPLNVKVTVNEGMLKDLIKVEIDDNNTNMINMIAGG